MAKEKEILKTADASFAAKVRDPNILICRAVHPTDKAFLPDGSVVQFINGLAKVTREQAEHLQDTTRFAFDVPDPGAAPVLPHSDVPDPTRDEAGPKG